MLKLLAFIPFVMMVLLISLVNKTQPYVMGMPFILFWIVLWTLLSAVIMLILYKLDDDR